MRWAVVILVDTQRADGEWTSDIQTLDRWPVVATSFALLFCREVEPRCSSAKWPTAPRNEGWNNDHNDMQSGQVRLP